MKPLITTMALLTGLWTGSVPPSAAQTTTSPSELPSERSEKIKPAPARPESSLEFNLKTEREEETRPPMRATETIRFHRRTVIDRFENTDDHGQILLSFSSDGVDLVLRGVNGAEGSVTGRD